jgi:OTU domain-containing protein 3
LSISVFIFLLIDSIRALSDQMDGTPGHHSHHRTLVCDHLSQNSELYQHFLDESEGSFESYVHRMRKEGVYGGNMEIVAFARLHNVDIAVHQPGSPVYTIRGGMDGKETNRPLLHVAYHSWEHYSSIRNLNGPLTGPPDIQVQEKKAEMSQEPTKMELSIMKTTGCNNLERIRDLMSQHQGNPNRVIDVLFENEEEPEAPEPVSPPIPPPAIEKPKKLSKHQKKMNAKAKKERMRLASVQTKEKSLLTTLEI